RHATHSGTQAPPIPPGAKRPPADLREVDTHLSQALQRRDYPAIASRYSQNPDNQVRLVREGGVDYSENSVVVSVYRDWLSGISNLLSVQVQDAAYYEFEGGEAVYAHGTLGVTVHEK